MVHWKNFPTFPRPQRPLPLFFFGCFKMELLDARCLFSFFSCVPLPYLLPQCWDKNRFLRAGQVGLLLVAYNRVNDVPSQTPPQPCDEIRLFCILRSRMNGVVRQPILFYPRLSPAYPRSLYLPQRLTKEGVPPFSRSFILSHRDKMSRPPTPSAPP